MLGCSPLALLGGGGQFSRVPASLALRECPLCGSCRRPTSTASAHPVGSTATPSAPCWALPQAHQAGLEGALGTLLDTENSREGEGPWLARPPTRSSLGSALLELGPQSCCRSTGGCALLPLGLGMQTPAPGQQTL